MYVHLKHIIYRLRKKDEFENVSLKYTTVDIFLLNNPNSYLWSLNLSG